MTVCAFYLFWQLSIAGEDYQATADQPCFGTHLTTVLIPLWRSTHHSRSRTIRSQLLIQHVFCSHGNALHICAKGCVDCGTVNKTLMPSQLSQVGGNTLWIDPPESGEEAGVYGSYCMRVHLFCSAFQSFVLQSGISCVCVFVKNCYEREYPECESALAPVRFLLSKVLWSVSNFSGNLSSFL